MASLVNINSEIHRLLTNSFGFITNKKVIVIESDDWGSIRMPSNNAFSIINNNRLDSTGTCLRFNKYDTLADKDDLMALFETLSSFRDTKGNFPVMTALSVVANPDFDKIRKSDFTQYYYEPFTTTLDRYYPTANPYPLWIEGIQNKLFLPQFHGREHLNVAVWIQALKLKDVEARIAFDNRLWGFNNRHKYGITYQAAFDIEDISQLHYQAEIIKDGLRLFEQLFGYRASYFVPPNGPFNNQLEAVAASEGIRFMFAPKIQYEPLGEGKIKKRFHYPGQQNRHGQYYLSRNCFFEQSEPGKDWVDGCLNDINIAFRFHKPAVISSHRVNYIGALDPANRTRGLQQLKVLLGTILKTWPDVEFLSSVELGELMVQS